MECELPETVEHAQKASSCNILQGGFPIAFANDPPVSSQKREAFKNRPCLGRSHSNQSPMYLASQSLSLCTPNTLTTPIQSAIL
jgi:hypothetical protein